MYDPEQAIEMQAMIDELNEILENTQSERVRKITELMLDSATIGKEVIDNMNNCFDPDELDKLKLILADYKKHLLNMCEMLNKELDG